MSQYDNLNAEQLATLERVKKAKIPAVTAWYEPFVANWLPEYGSKPTSLHQKLAFLLCDYKRPGSEPAFTCMLQRPGGSTIAEHTHAFNCGPSRNHNLSATFATGLVRRGVVSVRSTKVTGADGKGEGRYWHDITPKGWQVIAGALDRLEAGQANQKATPKAKKPRKGAAKAADAVVGEAATHIAAAETPISEAATVTEAPAVETTA